ncbi:hypothetical protein LEP1GSC055_0345 [Leptospira borgpetersenii str. Brem 307]|uniref:Uncharacterized protein n=1 Tax=Leptospira borgpetersenii str. Brem 328 TaxID=1049780 RepID=A0ABC9SHM8_LEPBO|nr:hypothetical protein LEP1GSC055_0345 [Leptospira borgpetersenii str. Brem 307]EMN17181.1 hypothetical protein LEP1GSC056_0550 [Leptospira borgpetersenii str. Brem 328]
MDFSFKISVRAFVGPNTSRFRLKQLFYFYFSIDRFKKWNIIEKSKVSLGFVFLKKEIAIKSK